MTHSDDDHRKIDALWGEAHDFDPKDPLFGLNRDEMSGPSLSRRATLRLLAASGMLTAAHFTPGFSRIARAAGKSGGTLTCGWAGVSEIVTLDPARIAVPQSQNQPTRRQEGDNAH